MKFTKFLEVCDALKVVVFLPKWWEYHGHCQGNPRDQVAIHRTVHSFGTFDDKLPVVWNKDNASRQSVWCIKFSKDTLKILKYDGRMYGQNDHGRRTNLWSIMSEVQSEEQIIEVQWTLKYKAYTMQGHRCRVLSQLQVQTYKAGVTGPYRRHLSHLLVVMCISHGICNHPLSITDHLKISHGDHFYISFEDHKYSQCIHSPCIRYLMEISFEDHHLHHSQISHGDAHRSHLKIIIWRLFTSLRCIHRAPK